MSAGIRTGRGFVEVAIAPMLARASAGGIVVDILWYLLSRPRSRRTLRKLAVAVLAVGLFVLAGRAGASVAPAPLFHCGSERAHVIYSVTAQGMRVDLLGDPGQRLLPKSDACDLAELVVMSQFTRTSAGIVPVYRHSIAIQPELLAPVTRWHYTWRVYPGPSEIRFVAHHGHEVVKFIYSFDFSRQSLAPPRKGGN